MDLSSLRLHYAGRSAEGSGWGVCNTNLRRELGRFVRLTNLPADVIFTPVADHNFRPVCPARARLTLAYVFFESELGADAKANAARFDTLYCGSTWCLRRLEEHGIRNGEVLIQGVDQEVFRPQPRVPDGQQFRIFSGGKFEWRKGQDLVIAAFKRFAAERPAAHLVCAWHNPWPELIAAMAKSPHVTLPPPGKPQVEYFTELLLENGLAQEQFTVLPQLGQGELAAQMAQTDCGLFPNRCEGGTNLMLMEYLSCGRPAAANRLTGHADLISPAIAEIAATEDERHWAVQEIDSIVSALEELWLLRGLPVQEVPRWSWADAAEKVMKRIRVAWEDRALS